MGKSNNNPNKWMVFISLPLQMGVTIYLMYMLGTWLDEKYHFSNGLAMKICTFIGIFASLYHFIREANRLNRDE